MATTPLFAAAPRTSITQFIPAFGGRPRVLFEGGSLGSQIRAVAIASTDAGANTLQLGFAKKLTLAAGVGTGNFVDNGGSADTITRSTGSFIADGWRVGDRLMVQDATTVANDTAVILTAVAATQLSLSAGGGDVDTAEEFAAGTFLARVTKSWYVDVPANSGTPSVVGVSGLNTTQAPWLDSAPDRLIELGPSDLLVGQLGTTLGTAETIDVTTIGFDY